MKTPSIEEILILDTQNIKQAITVINDGAQGFCFVVNDSGKLVGMLTDGDIRRALIGGGGLDSPVSTFMKQDPVSLPVSATVEEIQNTLTPPIRGIPLIDDSHRPVDYASLNRLKRIPVAAPALLGNELLYVTDCIKSNWISSQGSYIKRFEDMFRTHFDVPHTLAVSNGTVALHLALVALGVGPGDEVIVPDLTFAACANAVIYVGAKPVFVDIHPETLTMDPIAVERAISSRTKVIMAVHLYGHPCHMDELTTLADQHGLAILEDCAEALGTTYKGRKVGTFGDASIFSFFGNKTITTGEGGMILFKNRLQYDRATILRDHGMSPSKRYWHDEVGYNYRLTNIQAAIGVAQMEQLEQFLEHKRRIGKAYTEKLSTLPGITPAPELPWATNSYWLYTCFITPTPSLDRDELMHQLKTYGIETRPAFFPLHEMPPYQAFVSPNDQFPVSNLISAQGLSLPSAVTLAESEVKRICRAFEYILESNESYHYAGRSHTAEIYT